MEVNKEAPYIIIQGSGELPYRATLEVCDCIDFERRSLPCKHIYRLAFKLGMMEDLPKYKKKNRKLFDLPGEVERYRQMYLDGNISPDGYAAICSALEKEFS